MTCQTCTHMAKPGIRNTYCGGRDDLPMAYGKHHPLRQLPADNGKDCKSYKEHPAHAYGLEMRAVR